MKTRIRLHYLDDLRVPFDTELDAERTVAFDGPILHDELPDELLVEHCFGLFNRGSGHEHPVMYDGTEIRSLSVGDVVEVVHGKGRSTWWLCVSVGWKPIEGVRSKEAAR